jgi:hypothetical protein
LDCGRELAVGDPEFRFVFLRELRFCRVGMLDGDQLRDGLRRCLLLRAGEELEEQRRIVDGLAQPFLMALGQVGIGQLDPLHHGPRTSKR